MKIPNDFSKDLEASYESRAELEKLFTNHRPFIMRLVRHALRYHPWQMISDEDDLFQEACIILTDAMWRYDESRGPSLAEFVVYEIGGRLSNLIMKEIRACRNPKYAPKSIEFGSNTNGEGERLETKSSISEQVIYDPYSSDPESLTAIKHALEQVRDTEPAIVKYLLDALMENTSFAGACRDLHKRKIRTPYPVTDGAFRVSVRRHILPRLRSDFASADIIPVTHRDL